MDKTTKMKHSRWARFVPDESIYPLVSIFEASRSNNRKIVSCLLQDYPSVVLMYYLEWQTKSDPEEAVRSIFVVTLLQYSNFDDELPVRLEGWESTFGAKLADIMLDNRTMMMPSCYKHLLSMIGLTHHLIGNKDLQVQHLPFGVRPRAPDTRKWDIIDKLRIIDTTFTEGMRNSVLKDYGLMSVSGW